MVFVTWKICMIKNSANTNDRPTISSGARKVDKNMLTFSNFPPVTLQALW
jgi:hypothetical protein